MKKFCILVVLLLFVNLFGCSSEKGGYVSSISSIPNDGTIRKAEVEYWPGEYFEADCPQNATCSLDGVTYFGEYKHSITNKYDSFTTHVYFDENGIEFGIKDNSEELIYLNLMNKDFFDAEPYLTDVDDPLNFAKEFAYNLVSGIVDNLDDYTFILEDPVTREKSRDGNTSYITYYTMTFARKVGTFDSSDYVSVKVTSKGHLASMIIGDLNAFADYSGQISDDLLMQSIETKVRDVYLNSSYSLKSMSIAEQKLVKTPNGSVSIHSLVSVCLLSDETEFFSQIGIITKIPK